MKLFSFDFRSSFLFLFCFAFCFAHHQHSFLDVEDVFIQSLPDILSIASRNNQHAIELSERLLKVGRHGYAEEMTARKQGDGCINVPVVLDPGTLVTSLPGYQAAVEYVNNYTNMLDGSSFQEKTHMFSFSEEYFLPLSGLWICPTFIPPLSYTQTHPYVAMVENISSASDILFSVGPDATAIANYAFIPSTVSDYPLPVISGTMRLFP
jgi:hypothetical protein